MDPMFEVLLDLASGSTSSDLTTSSPVASTSSGGEMSKFHPPSGSKDDGTEIRALACACLLSIAVALGDTGKMLQVSTPVNSWAKKGCCQFLGEVN